MAHRLIHLAIYQGGVCAEETPADLTLLWNFGSEAELRTEDETFALRRDDVVSLRPQQRYSLRTGEGPVAAVALDGAQLRACLGGRRLAIRCNSAREVSDNYVILRGLLGQVLQAWAEGGPYLEAELGKLYYELALLLANCFSVDLPGEPGTRAEQFTRYLEDHCREELSLQQISEAFHMTPQYFSRQFKAQTGQNFYRSLTAVRLRRAKQDLAETDTPLLRLALDNGFANLESFYHYFQEDTGQTPQAWRAEHRRAETAAALPVLRELVGSLHLEAPAAAPQEEVFAVDAAVRRSYHPFWREVLHLGDAVLLDKIHAVPGCEALTWDDVQIASTIFAVKPGDGSAREQAASCQRVLGAGANIAVEYATKRYRSNLINWGMLPFQIAGPTPFGLGDYILIPNARKALAGDLSEIKAYVLGDQPAAFTLSIAPLTSDERQILADGCLINFYKH